MEMEPCDWGAEYLDEIDGARLMVVEDEIVPIAIAKSTVKRRGLPINLLDGAYYLPPTTPRREKPVPISSPAVQSERREDAAGYVAGYAI